MCSINFLPPRFAYPHFRHIVLIHASHDAYWESIYVVASYLDDPLFFAPKLSPLPSRYPIPLPDRPKCSSCAYPLHYCEVKSSRMDR